MSVTIPKFEREGFWWAKWLKADPGTADDGEGCSGDKWEPVEVVANVALPEVTDDWRVAVLGVEKSQSVRNFEWGPCLEAQKAEISALNATLAVLTKDRDDCRAGLDAIHEFLASEKLEEAYQAQKKVTL
jgi:hypothetical protein